jgi:hypothetical protein
VEQHSKLKGRESQWTLWRALSQIRSGRLYREKHSSFHAYLRSKGIEQSKVSRGLNALLVKDAIEERLWLYNRESVRMIMTENHLRELVGLDPDTLPEVVRIAGELAGEKQITSRHLKSARTKLSIPKAVRRLQLRVDENGDNVPGVMSDSYSARYALCELSEKLKAVAEELKAIAAKPGGQYVPLNEILLGLGSISRAIVLSGFGVTCQECSGVGCSSCRNTGFHPKRKLRSE